MNNWRLLLLAVVAVLQPIGSFTESNFIDGRQECCDHRSNSITQDTTLYRNYRKTPEEHRLRTREDIREERRYEARNDPITRSRERLTLKRAERRISFEPTLRFSTETRFARDQERRNSISVDARESRPTREDQKPPTRASVSGNSLSQYERNVLDTQRIKMSRDDTKAGRISNERLHRETLDSRDAQRFRNSEDLRRVPANKETIAVLNRERNYIARDLIRRDSRVSAFRSVTMLQLDNNRENRILDRCARDNADDKRRSRSQGSIVNSVNGRDDLRSRTDSREDRQSHFRSICGRVDERRQRDQNSEFRDQSSAIRRDLFERRESRDAVERVDRTRRNIRENHNERIDERRQQLDETRLFRERLMLREFNHGSSAERRQALARETRVLNANVQRQRVVRSNERREASRDTLRASGGSSTERRQGSRASRMSEATARHERLVRGDERSDERRQLSITSLNRVSEMRLSHESRSIERENNFRYSGRFPERSVPDERVIRYRRDVRSVERLDERRQQRDESRMSRDRTMSVLREPIDNFERRQESRTESLSRFELKSRSERASRIREGFISRKREERRASPEQTLRRMAHYNERMHNRELSRISRFAEEASSNDRISRIREDVRSERIDVHREIINKNRVSSDRTVMRRLTRDVLAHPQKYGSRNDESEARIQRTRTLEDSRDERREVNESDENRASRDRVSMTQRHGERTEDQRRESREYTRNLRGDARKHGDVRMGERFEIRRQRDDNRSQDRISAHRARDITVARSVERRSREEVTSRDAKMNIQSGRLSTSRDDRRIYGVEVRNNRDFRALESRRKSRRITESKVQPNTHNLAMELMDRTANDLSHEVRIEANLKSSDIVLAKDVRTDTRREAINTRFESKVREIDSVDEASEYQNVQNWKMIFYTLQGAYLCALLMQMLTEKSFAGKSRNFTWWSSSSKNLLKVD